MSDIPKVNMTWYTDEDDPTQEWRSMGDGERMYRYKKGQEPKHESMSVGGAMEIGGFALLGGVIAVLVIVFLISAQ